jgi:hypothetical protein
MNAAFIRALACDPNVSRKRKGKPAAGRRTMNEGDDGLRTSVHLQIDVGQVSLETKSPAEMRFCPVCCRLDVESGTEGPARASHHDNSTSSVVVEATKIVGQLSGHLCVDGVERLGTVQCQPVNGVSGFHLNRLIVASHDDVSLRIFARTPSSGGSRSERP